MVTLALDASTYRGTVALLRDGSVVSEREAGMRGEREERLMPAVVGVLSDAGVAVDDIEAVACGCGPGSFTSLRIAAAIAKAVAVARTVPLLVAPSPLLIVAGAEPRLPPGSYVAALDAMRGDVFALDVEVRADGRLDIGDASPRLTSRPAGFRASAARLIRRVDLEAEASARGARIVGPGGSPAVHPHARGFAVLLAQGLAGEVELDSWEPDYGRKAEAQVRWERAHGRDLETR